MLAETARLLCLGFSSTICFLLHVYFKSVDFFNKREVIEEWAGFLLYLIWGLEKKRLTYMNFGFDQADQSNRLEQKNNKFNIA